MTAQKMNARRQTAITINPSSANAASWTVDRRIFGKFFEMNGKDTYPGIIDECLANGSFEEWYSRPNADGTQPIWDRRTEILYRDAEPYPGLAYPWEPVGAGGQEQDAAIVYSQQNGGVHGKAEQKKFQRITLSGKSPSGGIAQRIALPDQRTRQYRLRLYVRGTATLRSLHVYLKDESGRIMASEQIAFGEQWLEHEVQLQLDRISDSRYKHSPFGEYTLVFLAEGIGNLDLDWVTLMSADAVEGLFNPETIRLIREYHVTTIRWGGNYASEYHWMDGIGPWKDRPIRNNLNWGGLEPNYMGTNEFLRFCKLTDVEPFFNVGFNHEIPPEEAAQWVEYVNGGVHTPMGKMRAEHGYPEPWGVQLWQVGNETYGNYQIGHTNSVDYAQRIRKYYAAMKAADPTITIVMAGTDPMYIDYSEVPGQKPIWNLNMFKIAGSDYMDGIDIHQYTRGMFVPEEQRSEKLQEWLDIHGADEVDYNQVLVAYPTQYEELLIELRESASPFGFDPLIIDIGEWNLEPLVNPGWPIADYPTMAHACYVAGMYNAFIRQGDAVKFSYQRDNTLYSRAYPVDMRPVNPGNETLRLYAEPFTRQGVEWRHLPIDVEGSSFTIVDTWVRIREMKGVGHVDASAILSQSGNNMILFMVNRDLKEVNTVSLRLDLTGQKIGTSSLIMQSSDTPFMRQTSWSGRNGYSVQQTEASLDNNGLLTIEMPAGSFVRLEVSLEQLP